MIYIAKILRASNKHMSYKVFSIDDSTKLCKINYADVIMITKKAPHRLAGAGSVLLYSRDNESDMCHQPWNREAHFRPVCEGFFFDIF